ncbi:unnamed protein product [Rotaria magnacalcarata]|uniref:Uncharacterized protein n=1 Tax=Rotaria magnacalcarata TaxID=392030 RepID=A0A814QUT3_9BILA|nr:unnamed protein product [Rotaria magnacalcarata]CAF1514390.1 unnamed protein product [Rotaria magnacalcarata]CAF1938284.1 unnamed protein product [Rotaria magnacalcarata]CAF3927964.1 unnamed protein product [Rotaria magnacalcarata]CAF4036953.1 unnamed protein product [Rotaria magnacalcarata]
MCLLLLFLLLLLFIQFSFVPGGNLSSTKSNCSLLFQVQRYYKLNKIETEFPIELVANYNFTCNVENLTASYKIIPLEILAIGSYNESNESFESMIQLNTTQFFLNINQSSTIQLCILLSSDESDNDYGHRICRQIQIGINILLNFWNLPMKIFYIVSICSIGSYHTLFILSEIWRKGWKKPKSKFSAIKRLSIIETKNDTFENEKVYDEDDSDEEDE